MLSNPKDPRNTVTLGTQSFYDHFLLPVLASN